MAEQVEIEVGNGPVTKAGIYAQIAAGLVAVGTFLTTITGQLPAGVSPTIGVVITGIAGASFTLAHLVVAFGRIRFAEAKASVLAGRSAYPELQVAFDDQDAVLDPEPPKSDTDMVPPVEPA